MNTSFTHDIEGRPRQGCPNASALDIGMHRWIEGEIDAWEWPTGTAKKGHILGDRTDRCAKCNLEVHVYIRQST